MRDFTDRLIRVFISSTFCDLVDEREYLIKRIFPNLINMAEKRYVTLVPIDLRWGISHDRSEKLNYSSKVINSCLKEIDKCRPFFIGIIGQNYGWCPQAEEIDDLCFSNFPCDWLKESLDGRMSITELEMQYAVLRNNKPIHAGFYIKDCTAEIDTNIQLIRLKRTIRENAKNKQYVVNNFNSKEQLGQQITADFKRLLDSLYPETNCSPMQHIQNAQKAFMMSRTRLYISTGDTFSQLDNFLREEQNLLAIISERGMGKSALIANWLSKVMNEGNVRTIFHFVFNGKENSNCSNVLNYLIEYVCNCYQLPTPKVFMDSKLTSSQTLKDILYSIPNDKPLLIVIDGVNQIVGEEDPKLLNWLPWALPTHIHLLLTSTRENTIIESLKKRKYQIIQLQPMQKTNLYQFIEQYLQQYGKDLSSLQINRIVSNKVFHNTLAVKILLDELIIFGQFELLNEQINNYLTAKDLETFFQQVFSRIENDFQDLPVKHILACIVFSKNGMSEMELQGMFCEILPLHWSQFYNSIWNHTITQNGRIIFGHHLFSEAALRRYNDIENEIRNNIIAYFIKKDTPRAYDELAHQYYSLKQLYNLYLILKKPDAFEYFYSTNEHLLYSYWYTMKHDNCLNDMNEWGEKLYKGLFCFLEINQKTVELACIFYHLGLFYEKYFEEDIVGFGPQKVYDKLAIDFFKRAIETMLLLGYENHLYTARFQLSLGLKLMHIKEYNIAFSYIQKGFETLTLNQPIKYETVLYLADFYTKFGKALLEKENLKYDKHSYSYGVEPYDISSAMKCHKITYELYKSLYGEDNPITARILCYIGAEHSNIRNFDKALIYVKKAVEIQEKFLSNNDIDLGRTYELLGRIYLRISNNIAEEDTIIKRIQIDKYVDLSYEFCTKAIQIFTEILGSKHFSVLDLNVYIFDNIYLYFLSRAEDFLDDWRSLRQKGHYESALECAKLSLQYYTKYSNLTGSSLEDIKSVIELKEFLSQSKG